MPFTFKIIEKSNINSVVPLMQKLTQNKYPDEILKERFAEMVNQNYECAGAYDDDKLIGISGMWFCTRHYAGKSIDPAVDLTAIYRWINRLINGATAG